MAIDESVPAPVLSAVPTVVFGFFALRVLGPDLIQPLFDTSQTTNLTNENIASFQRQIGPGNLDLTGGITVQTAGVALGYWRDEALTAQRFADEVKSFLR